MSIINDISMSSPSSSSSIPDPLPTDEELAQMPDEELQHLRRTIVASCNGMFANLPESYLRCACSIHNILRTRIQGPSSKTKSSASRGPTKKQLQKEKADTALSGLSGLLNKKD